MEAGIQDDERVHLRAQIDECSGAELSLMEGHLTRFIDGDFAEEVHVHREVAFAEIVFSELRDEAVVRVAIPVVARLLIGPFAVFRLDDLRVGTAGERIVPAARVLGDRDQNAAHVGVEAEPLVSRAMCWHFSVSGRFNRSLGSSKL